MGDPRGNYNGAVVWALDEDEERLAREWLGYGSFDAPYWFIGLEPFLSLAFSLGARRGELLALRWSAVDFDRRVVAVEASVSQTKGRVEVKTTKTDRVRTVPLSAFALDALRRQRAAQAQDKLAAGPAYQDAGFVFADALGAMLSPWAATRSFARIALSAGASTTRLHDARHTAATTMLVSGTDARTVAGILGHSSAVTTLAVYAHLLAGPMVTAADHLGAAMELASVPLRKA
jgi:integrase